LIRISEEGRQVALVIFAHILKANGVRYQEVTDFAKTQQLPESRHEVFSKLKLMDTESGKPSIYAEALAKIIQKSAVLRGHIEEQPHTTNIVSLIRNSLLQRLLQSDSQMTFTEDTSHIDLIPSEWIYRLGAYDEHERDFDILQWISNSSDDEIEHESRTNGLSLIADPGHGKTKWIEQSAIELWNSQWTDENRASTMNQLPWASSILPVIIDLRKIAIFPDTKKGHVICFENNSQPLWPISHLKYDPPFHKVNAQLLKAILGLLDSDKDVESKVKNLKYGKQFILFLDGWDELSDDAKSLVSDYVEFYMENGVRVVISSRILDSSLERLTSTHQFLKTPTDDDIIRYAKANGLDLNRTGIQNIRKWIGIITPLDLRVLTVFPELDNLPQNRVALYRNWTLFQTIREGCIDGLRTKFKSIEQVKEFLATKKVTIKGNHFNLLEMLYGFATKSETIGPEEDYSIMHYLSKVAYLEMTGRNQVLDYKIAIETNPLLTGFIDTKWTQDLRPYPQVRRKHLIPYLAAEFILREYLSFEYWSVDGDPFTLSDYGSKQGETDNTPRSRITKYEPKPDSKSLPIQATRILFQPVSLVG
jgi:hypothetical protein